MKKKFIKKIFACVISGSMVLSPLTTLACTSFLLKGNDGGFVYGRTMEFGFPLKSDVIMVPRNFKLPGVGIDGKPGTGLNWTTKYAAVGMNGVNLPILLDGMNEKGLVGGLLNAPNTAMYQDVSAAEATRSISSAQLLIYALTNFATVEEVKEGLKKILVNKSTIPAYHNQSAPVHMTLHDRAGKSIVVEYLKGQLVITDNPTSVLTNDPEFNEHLNSIGNYSNLTKVERPPVVINGATFNAPSSGSGLHGMPGDFLSPSRFIRAIFLSSSAPSDVSTEQQVNTAWHILGSFDIPPGAITLPASNPYGGGSGGFEITEWTVVADNKNMMYYVKPFENTNAQAFDMKKADMNAKDIQTIKMNMAQTYLPLN